MNDANPYTTENSTSAESSTADFSTEGKRTNTKPRVWTCFAAIFFGLFLAVFFQAIMGALLAFSMMAQGVDAQELTEQLTARITKPDLFLLTLVLGQAGFAIAVLLAGRMSPEPLRQRLGFFGKQIPWKLYGLTMLGSIFVLAISIGLVYLVAMLLPPDKSVEMLFETMTPLWGIAFVILIAFLPGFIEETLFRGYIQTRFLQRWSPVNAILFSSVLFALVHITPHAIAVALPLGIWFGYIAWRTNSIGPGIACHAFVNGGLNLWRMIAKFGELSETSINVGNGILVFIGVVAFFFAMKMLVSLPKPEEKLAPTVN